MKGQVFFILVFFVGCANHRPSEPIDDKTLAHDSIADGKVRASATKKVGKQEVCFTITITLNGATLQEALPRNWSLAWVDKSNHYRLLSINQRNPALVPRGDHISEKFMGRHEWSNTFRSCAARAELDDVKSIVLTPKHLPYEEKRSLKLNWEK